MTVGQHAGKLTLSIRIIICLTVPLWLVAQPGCEKAGKNKVRGGVVKTKPVTAGECLQFFTDPGDNSKKSSKYYWCGDRGLMRLKMVEGSVHVRPGKKYCSLASTELLTTLREWRKRKYVVMVVDRQGHYDLIPEKSGGKAIQCTYDATPGQGHRPIDFYVEDSGALSWKGGFHAGHPVSVSGPQEWIKECYTRVAAREMDWIAKLVQGIQTEIPFECRASDVQAERLRSQ